MSTPTKRQFDLMALAAGLGRITSADVHNRFGLKKTTAATLLGDCAKAGLLRCDDSQQQYKFYPIHDAEAVAKMAADAGVTIAASKPVTPPAEPAAPVIAPDPVVAQAPYSKIERALDGLVEAIVERVSTTLADRMQDIIADSMDKLAERMQQINSTTPATALPKVVIAGLLPAQRNMIESEYKGCYRFSFLDANKANAQTIRARTQQADQILVMGDFVNHAMTETINSTGRKPEIVRGGMTALREILTQRYVKE